MNELSQLTRQHYEKNETGNSLVSKVTAIIEASSMTVWILTGRKQMDPVNSIWYYLEFQRQFSAAKRSSSEPFAKPESRPNKLAKVWLV
jgi:hypothetical protein